MKQPALTGLLPLEPPPAPPQPAWIEGLPLLIGLVVIGLLGLWLRRPVARQRRGLRRLQRYLERPGTDARQAAAKLDALLRQSLGVGRLDIAQVPDPVSPADWQRLLRSLHAARFARPLPTAAQVRELLPVARKLIGRRRDLA